MKPRARRTTPVRLLAAAGLLACLGCGSAELQSGIRIGDRTLQEFEAGRTRESWVLAVLGEPSSSAVLSDEPSVRVLRYATTEPEKGGFLSSLLGRGSSRNVATIYFVVRDGMVERFWADRAETGGLLGKDEESGEKRD
jgi:hypothetical protein